METDETGAARPDVIDDAHDPRLRKVRELLRGKNPRSRVIVVDDDENIVAAVRAGVELFTVFRTEDDDLGPELAAALPAGTEVQVLSVRVAKELFGVERRSRVFALARKPRPVHLDELLDAPGDVIVLDGVRLMGNIGAILRSTRALGFAGVVLLDSALASTTDRRLVRASRGMVFSVPVVLSTADELLPALEEWRLPLVSLEPQAGTPLPQIAQIPGRVALLLGSERHGPSGRLTQAAAHRVTIAIHPEVESLNVSVSAALAMYQRRESNPLPSA